MRRAGILGVAFLLVFTGVAFAGPEGDGEGCGGCGDKVAGVERAGVGITLADTTDGETKKILLVLSGDWKDVPEEARARLLGKLGDMLPQNAFKAVLEDLVAGKRKIETSGASSGRSRPGPSVRLVLRFPKRRWPPGGMR